MLSSTALGVGSLFGSIWTGGASAAFGGMASGSVAVLGFIAPLLIGAGTSRKIGERTGESRVIQTKALSSAAGDGVRQKVSQFVEVGSLY